MANKVRGETTFALAGVSYTVALGMGALAEIEDAFGVESFEEAVDFSGKVSARKLRKLLIAIMAGNDIAITDGVKSAINRLDLEEFMEIVTRVMTISTLDVKPAGEAVESGSPLAVASAGVTG